MRRFSLNSTQKRSEQIARCLSDGVYRYSKGGQRDKMRRFSLNSTQKRSEQVARCLSDGVYGYSEGRQRDEMRRLSFAWSDERIMVRTVFISYLGKLLRDLCGVKLHIGAKFVK